MKKMLIIILSVVMTLSMVGCSSEASDSAISEDGVKVIKVGTGNGAPPFCYLDENGESVGYDIDLLEILDERLVDYKFEVEAMDFSTMIVSIDSGAVDFVSHELVKSDARKEKYLFPEQYYNLAPMSLVVTDDSGIETFEDMVGKSIDSNPSSYEYGLLLAYNEEHLGSEMTINAVSDQTNADAYKKVSIGQTDAYLTYASTYDQIIGELGVDNLVLTETLMVEDVYMMFNQDQQEICDAIGAELKAMIEDGTLSELSQEWFNEDVFVKYPDLIQSTVD